MEKVYLTDLLTAKFWGVEKFSDLLTAKFWGPDGPIGTAGPMLVLIIHAIGSSFYVLESVSKLHQGLHSFRNMRRMEASFKNARALRLRFSQSLARRRQRLSHAIVRSTIQRLGNCTNPLA